MGKRKNILRGVSCRSRNGVEYWYVRLGGEKKYCGKGDKGFEIAVAAKGKEVAQKYENKEASVGLKVKKVTFKTVTDLSNWYMQLPTIQKLSSYQQKVSRCSHLLKYFGYLTPWDQIPSCLETIRQLFLQLKTWLHLLLIC